MAKLTQTELKVLASEIQSRVSNVLSEKRKKIEDSTEYKNFEKNFDKEEIGKLFNDVIEASAKLELVLAKEGYVFNIYEPKLSERAISNKNQYVDTLRNKLFPFPKIELEGVKINQWRTSNITPYDYALHQLNLEQLTTNSNVSEVIDKLVNTLLKKII